MKANKTAICVFALGPVQSCNYMIWHETNVERVKQFNLQCDASTALPYQYQ